MPITPQELIANLGDLPPLPQVASQVLRVSADPDANAEDLRKVIAMDQALTSLRHCNLVDYPAYRQLGAFDVIFCRNVLIYFDDAAKVQVLKGFH
ncbi:MAG TPA: CheR family methyltransferase, partial [Polyangia bacterium]